MPYNPSRQAVPAPPENAIEIDTCFQRERVWYLRVFLAGRPIRSTLRAVSEL